jgi:hypothetical protein
MEDSWDVFLEASVDDELYQLQNTGADTSLVSVDACSSFSSLNPVFCSTPKRPVNQRKNPKPNVKTMDFTCGQCKKTYLTRSGLDRHGRIHRLAGKLQQKSP